MKLNKVTRRWVATLLAAVLVCLQLVTAAYACMGTPSSEVLAMADMPDCEGMSAEDTQQPQWCKAHCDRDKQTVNSAPVVDALAPPVLDWLITRLLLVVPTLDGEALPATVAAHTGPPDGSPPPYLAFLVLRN
ncbi:hypothetical protein OOT46_26905 [Aquabacterium sp. A7-Y]|uniref:hypothetical protein n=1 Tax=Aquabacterium sp. A7-Y TaxID=1349605 RepID=UPI00223D6A12|nr:hypothetical protein [Aquabacterium sp. A7-Y]MCW7541443.1 hypothetical protein [Aquabacterium sp. A7-Y]